MKKILASIVALAVLGIMIPKTALSQPCGCPTVTTGQSDPGGLCPSCPFPYTCYDANGHDGDCSNAYYIKFVLPSSGCNIDSVIIHNDDGACFSPCFGVEDPNNNNLVAQWPGRGSYTTCHSTTSNTFYVGGSVPWSANGTAWLKICTTGSSGGWHWHLELFSGGVSVCNTNFIN